MPAYKGKIVLDKVPHGDPVMYIFDNQKEACFPKADNWKEGDVPSAEEIAGAGELP